MIKKYKYILILISFISILNPAFAMLNLELTQGVQGAIPIAIIPFETAGFPPSQPISDVITHDLKNSGRFKVSTPSRETDFHRLGLDNVVVGTIQNTGSNHYRVTFKLLDVVKKSNASSHDEAVLLQRSFDISDVQSRALAHHISDLIYQSLTGVRGVFSTRLAYILVEHSPKARYTLEVSDQDGFNPRPLLTSQDPIMSPAWSPSGKQIAYVSFENQRASIYIEEVATGARHLVSQFPGINGAPAWSPDGRKLALVLSKSGSPNIYTIDIATHQLTPMTHDWSINTEPAFSPDGKSIIFTSNRGGSPQIYQKNLATGAISRVTYDGRYNARASFSADNRQIVMLNQDAYAYNIGVLNLDSGAFKILTRAGNDHESPSFAPNGAMVLYGMWNGHRNVLGMVATDGSIQVQLPAQQGDVQDPAWSPYLS